MMRVSMHFQPRDFWIGVYINPSVYQTADEQVMYTWTVYVCLVPMLPIVLYREREQTPAEERAIIDSLPLGSGRDVWP